MMLSSPASRALAATSLTPSKLSPMAARVPTHSELISTPTIQALRALPQDTST